MAVPLASNCKPPRVVVGDDGQSGSGAVCLDEQPGGVDVAAGWRQVDGHQQAMGAAPTVDVDLPHRHNRQCICTN